MISINMTKVYEASIWIIKDLPGPIFTEPYELAKQLKDLDKVQHDYQDKIDAFYHRFCSVDKGTASQYIGDLIHKDIEG